MQIPTKNVPEEKEEVDPWQRLSVSSSRRLCGFGQWGACALDGAQRVIIFQAQVVLENKESTESGCGKGPKIVNTLLDGDANGWGCRRRRLGWGVGRG